MKKIHGIPAFSDNYIWCIYDDQSNKAILVDPGSFNEADNFLQNNRLHLEHILITHHHPDHTGGASKLANKYGAKIYASSQSTLGFVDHYINDGDQLSLLDVEFTAIDVPGHTLDHNAYYCKELSALFCGDTLFSGGCGRLFEGSPAQMLDSLKKFLKLPNDTKIYCAHEYTLSNLEFAKHLMPNNIELGKYIDKCTKLREQSISTLPSTLEIETTINPFLRFNDRELINTLKNSNNHNSQLSDELGVFTATRLAKDSF